MFIFIKNFKKFEFKDVIEDKDNQFFSALKSVFSHKSYVTLLLAFLFYSLSVQVKIIYLKNFFILTSNLSLLLKQRLYKQISLYIVNTQSMAKKSTK